ncbi:hypothetical protein ALP71_01568 [Pseudomonas coronafaciens pv. garcae]|nr:hypothetical protein ALP71_01568 [Pseudomonas coronafaciens pv. garcae]
MKADSSDAPKQVMRRRHKHSVFYTVTCLVIGSVATIGALQWVSRAPGLDSAYKQTISPAGKIEALARASDMPARQGPDSSWLRASSETRLPANTAHQTVFNDQNFIPEGADNVVALRVGSDLSLRKEASKKVKLTIVRQSPSMKDRACWPYRQGSIQSRNCRASIGLNHRD